MLDVAGTGKAFSSISGDGILAASAQQAQALAADVSRQQKLLRQKIEQLHEEVIWAVHRKGWRW